jgi:hypothetical protein
MAYKLKNFFQDLKENERVNRITSLLPPLNFITVHYSYFILTSMIFSVIFWGSSDPAKSISYTDSLFLVVSAMTEAGLNTVNLSQMTTFQQVLLWILIIIGSNIFVSISTVLTRKRVFESRFNHVVKLQKEARCTQRRSMSMMDVRDVPVKQRLKEGRKPEEHVDGSDFESRHCGPRFPTPPPPSNLVASPKKLSDPTTEVKIENEASTGSSSTSADAGKGIPDERERSPGGDADHISFMRYAPSPTLSERRVLNFVGVGAHPNTTSYKPPYSDGIYSRANRKEREKTGDEEDLHHWQYPNYLTRHTTGRNAQFFGLSKAEREHLGGVEYRGITLLGWIVPLYFTLWQLIGCLGLAAYVAYNKASTAEENGINPWYVFVNIYLDYD